MRDFVVENNQRRRRQDLNVGDRIESIDDDVGILLASEKEIEPGQIAADGVAQCVEDADRSFVRPQAETPAFEEILHPVAQVVVEANFGHRHIYCHLQLRHVDLLERSEDFLLLLAVGVYHDRIVGTVGVNAQRS